MTNQRLVRRYLTVEIEKLYDKATRLGEVAGRIFGGQRSERSRSQMTNLLNVANRSDTPARVISHVKDQAGRHNEWHQENFAADLLEVLEQDLRAAASRIADRLPSPPSEEEFYEIHLQLIREFIVHMKAEYEYSRTLAAASSRPAGANYATQRHGGNRR